MNALTLFQFDAASIRVITSPDGEPLFVAKDIAEALGYADPTNAIKDHCRGVAKRHPIQDALGRTQEARVITEPDVLRLIVKSNLPSAERFERLVFEEILPTIRKTGSYGTPGAGFDIPKSLPEALRLAAEALEQKAVAEAKAQALEAVTAEQKAALDAAAPALRFTEDVGKAINGQPVQEVAKVIGTGERRLFAWLRQIGLLMGNNQPYQEYLDRGYFKVLEKRRHDQHGEVVTYTQTLITGKGLQYIHAKWNNQKEAA